MASESLNRRKEVVAQMPWVTQLKSARQCTAVKQGKIPLKVRRGSRADFLAAMEKHRCQNRAVWKFKSLKNSYSHDGTYCWSHLLFHGIYGDMQEEKRTRDWMMRNFPKGLFQ